MWRTKGRCGDEEDRRATSWAKTRTARGSHHPVRVRCSCPSLVVVGLRRLLRTGRRRRVVRLPSAVREVTPASSAQTDCRRNARPDEHRTPNEKCVGKTFFARIENRAVRDAYNIRRRDQGGWGGVLRAKKIDNYCKNFHRRRRFVFSFLFLDFSVSVRS